MKSRISYFDKTIFRKTMTRFAPAWVLYLICLLMGMMLMADGESGYGFQANLSHLLPVMGSINMMYALLAAQLIFSDLYNSRMCNAIHALPVTRESLFGSYVAAGLTWSLVPTAIAAALALLLGLGSEISNGWMIPLWWLLGTNLQYLFFFGLASFSALCVGNRFAQAMVYGIINFASVITYWLVDTLYTPMLYGVSTDQEPFMKLSPVVWFASSEYINVDRNFTPDGQITSAWFEMSDGWGYLAIFALVGVGLLIAACLLYRRRQLESAGDFMAVKVLEPVFLAVYSLIVAAGFYFVCDDMLGVGGMAVIYMGIGLAIGFVTGEMLLQRTILVFHKKAFLKFAALAAAFGASLGLTALDPFGIEAWIPGTDEVASVEISPYYGYSDYYAVLLETPEEIEDAIRVHEIALEERYDGISYYGPTVEQSADLTADGEEVYDNYQPISLHYHLKNGITKSRYYTVNLNSEIGELAIPYFNTPEAIFRDIEGVATFEAITNATQTILVNCSGYTGDYLDDGNGNPIIIDAAQIRELMNAIEADAALGVMAQNWDFRPDPRVGSTYWLDFDMGNQYTNVTIYADCINTNTWLRDHGFYSPDLESYIEYGEIAAVFEK